MKNLLILAVCSLLLFSCKKDTIQTADNFVYTGPLGDVITMLHEDSLTVSQLAALLPGQITGLVTLRHSIHVYTIEYKTLNLKGDTVKASGVVVVPDVDSFSI